MLNLIKSMVIDLKEKNFIVKSSLLICTLTLLLIILSGEYNKFHLFTELYGIIVCFSLTVMTFAKLNKSRNRYFRNLGQGFIYIGLLMLVHMLIYLIDDKVIDNVFLVLIINYFQIITLNLSGLFCKKNMHSEKLNLIYSCIFILTLGVNILIITLGISEIITNKFIVINCIVQITISIIYCLKISKSKVNEYINNKNRMILFILFTTIGSSLYLIGDIYLNNYLLIGGLIGKFFGYLYLFLFIEDNALNIYYQYTKEIIDETQKELRETNNKLIVQNRNLEESKRLFEKSDKSYLSILNSINKGVYLFVDDKLYNMNSKGEKFLKVRNYKEVDCELEYILWNLTDQFFSDDELEFGFMKDFYVKNDNESIDIRVYLLRIDVRSKFILVSNTSEFLEYRHLNDYLETYLNAEKTSDDFYSNISHELRTPINVISSALQLNEIYLENENYDGVKKYNTIIRKNCLRLIRTINNFIDADKLEGGFFELNKKRYNIINIIDQVIDVSIKYFKNNNTQIIFDPEEEEAFLLIDKVQLQRILLNIFSNTLKYGKKENGLVEVKTRKRKRYVEISIHNDAPAIPEDKRRYIFDKFTKVDSSLARPSEGSGLGLFLTKALVEANNGSIELTSDEYGNTFRMVFPVCYYDVHNEENECESLMDLEEKVDIEFADVYF